MFLLSETNLHENFSYNTAHIEEIWKNNIEVNM